MSVGSGALGIATAVVALAGLPSAALAGVVSGTADKPEETYQGVMVYRASANVANDVTVRPHEPDDEGPTLLVRDAAEPIEARGDCVRLDRHTARCPWTESARPVRVFLRDGADRAKVVQPCYEAFPGCVPLSHVELRGGVGDDRLAGGGWFYGGRGNDTLLGTRAPVGDRLHGGPGRDHMMGYGGPNGPRDERPQDVFVDGETDPEAARDTIRAGRQGGALIDYSERRRSLRIDLRRSRIAPEGDRISGVRDAIGGGGSDSLVGTDRPNLLAGGAGDDRLVGRGGDDRLAAGSGDDEILGGTGDDRLTESFLTYDSGGRDVYVGGPGADDISSRDAVDGGNDEFQDEDAVRCDARDPAVQSDARDALSGCRLIHGWGPARQVLGGHTQDPFEMHVQPEIQGETAVFTVRCGAPTETETYRDPAEPLVIAARYRCRGELTVRAPDGKVYGRADFVYDMGAAYESPWFTVGVPLSDAGLEDMTRGRRFQVEARARPTDGTGRPIAGYRAVLAR